MKFFKSALCLVLAVLCLTLCCCSKESTSLTAEYTRSEAVPQYDFYSDEVITPENYEFFTKAYMDFTAKLLVNSKESESVVLSPLSLFNALAMTSNGASGKTQQELEKVLGQGIDTTELNTYIHYLNSRVQSVSSEDGKVDTANSLWLNDEYSVKAQFLQTVVNYFNAEVFRTSLNAEEINTWISEKTEGEITDMLSELSSDTAFVLVNALLFDDEWIIPYSEDSVYTGGFNGTKGEELVDFMSSNEMLIKSSDAKGFVKSYKNTPCKFVAILPDENVDIDEYVSSLSGSKLETLFSSLSGVNRCEAHIPQFELRTSKSLTDTVKAMGANLMFTEDANFDSLTMSEGLMVSDIVQESFISVSPKTTEASSSSAVVIAPSAATADESDIESLVFDRPFVFMIVENESNLPLFIGTVKSIH